MNFRDLLQVQGALLKCYASILVISIWFAGLLALKQEYASLSRELTTKGML